MGHDRRLRLLCLDGLLDFRGGNCDSRRADRARPHARPRSAGEAQVKWLYIVPGLAFVAIAAVFFVALYRENASPEAPLPSPLIGKPVPKLELAALDPGFQGF